jgi:eight-cysteine-cluster-containing protein
VVAWATLFCASCGDRDPSVDPGSADFGRFEAPDDDNDCVTDLDCVVSGCSDEVCAAIPLVSTCEVLETAPAGDCGCVDGACQWWLPPVAAQSVITSPEPGT